MSKKTVKKNKKFKLNPFAVVALVVCAVAVIYTATTAWLTGEPLNPIRFTTLQDFDYKMNVYFLQDDGTKVDQGVYTSSTGAIKLDYTNSSAPNYVSKLRAEIKQLGNGVAFSRVKVSHEWLYTPSEGDETRLQGDANLPYTINTDEFVDKRMSDGYIYHEGALEEGDGYVEVINGFDGANFDTSAISALSGTVELSLNITVDAVQFNRCQQFWGTGSRPWA
jgi:hypothetical protein